MRISLYLGRRDNDIVQGASLDKIEQGDINHEVKSLIRDGIRYRNMDTSPPVQVKKTLKPSPSPSIDRGEDDFGGIELKQKQLDRESIANKLANF